jgi:hypothetical protein
MKRTDSFERELVEAYESGKLKSIATRSELDRLRAAARATATKRKSTRRSAARKDA